jgi:uncharacterized protein YhfF
MDDEQFRRVASNQVIIDEEELHQCVVELIEGRVVNYYCFEDELPVTEWLGGTIILERDGDGVLRAYKDGKKIQ